MTKNHVLTSGRCTEISSGSLIAKFRNRDSFGVHWIIIDVSSRKTYKEWYAETYGKITIQQDSDDVAVLTLKQSVNINPIRINYFGLNEPGSSSKFIGWGRVTDSVFPIDPQKTELKLLSNDECRDRMKKNLPKQGKFTVPMRVMCATSNPAVSLADGDFGGPVFNKKDKVMGIVIRRAGVPNPDNLDGDQTYLVLILEEFRDFLKHVTHGY
ncbi:hypothetical protein QAD02_023618 [Eretmocerus hayati]|uniref:Uncharacterized protein n=1 Tax=Eretmocerus hayati TaxID=131215 RepID=A0ACC2PX12_9HYME|nr:hypothetical protein QAD02_023618 [Eretmocerus hayati]